MKILKYNSYINKHLKKVNENLFFNSDDLMEGVDYIKMDFSDKPFNFNINKFDDNFTLEKLKKNPEFNKNLSKNELFISEFHNTKNFDTFLINDVKYILIHKRLDKDMNKLEKLGYPNYIIIQSKNINDKWIKENINLYKINKNFNNFYKKLSSKVIELIKSDDKKYIYVSNGKNWILKNIENRDIIFKDVMSNDDIKNVIKNTDIKIKTI